MVICQILQFQTQIKPLKKKNICLIQTLIIVEKKVKKANPWKPHRAVSKHVSGKTFTSVAVIEAAKIHIKDRKQGIKKPQKI